MNYILDVFLSDAYWKIGDVKAEIERLLPMAIARKDLPHFKSISSRLLTIKLNRANGNLDIYIHYVTHIAATVKFN